LSQPKKATAESMSSTTLPSGVTPASAAEQINSTVNTVLTATDSASADRIQNLSMVHQARVSRLTRTATSVAAQYGAKSTEATAAQEAVTAAQTTVARIDVVHKQVATTAPQVAAAGWALHGRVYDAQLQPVSGHTVFLVDSQKNYQRAYGFAYTDNSGYFLINFAGEDPAPLGQSAATSESSAIELYVEIANTNAKPVYLSSAAFQPRLGNAAYQNITLSAGEPVIGDPPEAIRKVALPSLKTDSTNAQVKNVVPATKMGPAPTALGKEDPATPAAGVAPPTTQPTPPEEVLPAGLKAATSTLETLSSGPTTLMSRFIAENYPRIEHELTAGPVTKSAFLQHYGNLTAENGDTVSNLLASLPADSVFTSVDAIPDALAQREAETVQASSGVAAILAQAFGVAIPAGPIAAVTVGKFVAMPANLRTSLPVVGIKTLANLAGATSATVSRLATKLKQNNVAISLGDLAQFAGEAKVLVRLQ
jgi:hypothetical protein